MRVIPKGIMNSEQWVIYWLNNQRKYGIKGLEIKYLNNNYLGFLISGRI